MSDKILTPNELIMQAKQALLAATKINGFDTHEQAINNLVSIRHDTMSMIESLEEVITECKDRINMILDSRGVQKMKVECGYVGYSQKKVIDKDKWHAICQENPNFACVQQHHDKINAAFKDAKERLKAAQTGAKCIMVIDGSIYIRPPSSPKKTESIKGRAGV